MEKKNMGMNSNKERIKLQDHFTYGKLVRFTLSPIAMMIFTSIYGIVDGLFVSNFVGKTPFAALNLIMPFISVVSALGILVGAGGNAIVGKTLGEGKDREAKEYFSMFVYITIISGIVVSILGCIFMRKVGMLFGASGELLDYCVLYGDISMISMTFFLLQFLFQNFFVTAEKPELGFYITLAAGITNMVLDFLFVGVFKWGLAGAASATVCSEFIGGGLPLIYFARKNDSLLSLTKATVHLKVLGKACFNGMSELVSSLSMSFVSILFNYQLMRIAGQNGVAAYGAMMYVGFVFVAIFLGYSLGTSPVISFNYGAANHNEMKNLYNKSWKLMFGIGFVMAFICIGFAWPICDFFVGYDEELLKMTHRGICFMGVSYVVTGFNIFGSGLFTALNNGIVSAIISTLRSVAFKSAAVMILPIFMGIDGVWVSAIIAEVGAFIVTMAFIVWKNKEYGYY